MPPTQRYEWLCLRALKPRECRSYTTSQTPTPDETVQNSTPPPSPTADTPPRTQSTSKTDHIRSYLEEQDLLALAKLKSKVQQIQTNAALAESLLSSYTSSTSTMQLIPSIPRYDVVHSKNSRRIVESRIVTDNLKQRTQIVLDNIWDLENIPYPYEKGPSVAEKYREEVKALVERGVKKEIEAERTDMRNLVDVYKKRFEQKAEGLWGVVGDMRTKMGMAALPRITGSGSVVGGYAGTRRLEIVEETRNPFARKMEKLKEDVAAAAGGSAAGTATTGAGKVEAEADAINPANTTGAPTEESADTIGTAKIEAEAEEVKTEAAKLAKTESTADETRPVNIEGATPAAASSSFDFHQGSYHPMIATPTPSSEPKPTVPETPSTAPKSSAKPPRSQKKAREQEDRSIGAIRDQLLKSLQNEVAQKRGEVDYGQTAAQIEAKKDVDEKRENPFARQGGRY